MGVDGLTWRPERPRAARLITKQQTNEKPRNRGNGHSFIRLRLFYERGMQNPSGGRGDALLKSEMLGNSLPRAKALRSRAQLRDLSSILVMRAKPLLTSLLIRAL